MTDPSCIFCFGAPIDFHVRAIALNWDVQEIGDDPRKVDLQHIPAAPGIYAVEGCHDGNPSPSVLYIGRAVSLKDRVVSSLGGRVWWRAGEESNRELRLFSDVWSVRVRWAQLDENLIQDVEALLTVAHAPAYNSQNARISMSKDRSDLFILNAGKKGRLLPTVAGAYFCNDLWPE